MVATIPFLTSYDPPGTSEGTLDPLGLYQIADQLAVQLVPSVRERMQRIRFLTAMAVGAIVTEGVEDDPEWRDASPYLVWEWLVVESLIRCKRDDPTIWGVPGSLVTRRAMDRHGYLDARSYLKTPRIFGMHGVYKRLATHLGLVDVHLGPGPNAASLVDAWARGEGYGGLADAKAVLSRWTAAVRRSLGEAPPRTKPGWRNEDWTELAKAFSPSTMKAKEKRFLRDMLTATDDRRLGAFPILWELQSGFSNDEYSEERLHDRLEQREPAFAALLAAIRYYESFARHLQDAFDILLAEGAGHDACGFAVRNIAKDPEFASSVHGAHERFERAHRSLGEINVTAVSLQNLMLERFARFAEPLDAAECAAALCSHHEEVQRAKSADGKRPWFDRIADDRIYVRHAYRDSRRPIQPDRYLHAYRAQPIRKFYTDLA